MTSSLQTAHNTIIQKAKTGLPYSDRYCPYCLTQVDEQSGDHWHGGCEYERAYHDWVNPQQPLTRAEVIEIKLKRVTGDIQRLSIDRRDLIVELDKLTKKLKEQEQIDRVAAVKASMNAAVIK